MIIWACVKEGIAGTSSTARIRHNMCGTQRNRMVMSIPDPGGFGKTIIAFQHLDPLWTLGKGAIIRRLLKMARLLTRPTPARGSTELVEVRDAPFRGQGRSE